MHLWHRARRHHLNLFPNEIVGCEWYALPPARCFALATEAEARRLVDVTFRAICQLPLAE